MRSVLIEDSWGDVLLLIPDSLTSTGEVAIRLEYDEDVVFGVGDIDRLISSLQEAKEVLSRGMDSNR